MKNNKKAILVMSHPDDEAFGIGGTIAKLSKAGFNLKLIEVTDGGSGQVHKDSQKRLNELGSVSALRKEELEESTKILGILEIFYLNYKDGSLDNRLVYEDELVDKIKKIIKKEKPSLVISYDQTGISWHLDHIVTSLACSRAVFELGELVDKYFVLNANKERKSRQDYVLNHMIKASHFVDVSKFVEIKKKAIRCHKSQKSDWQRYFKHYDNKKMRKENFCLRLSNRENKEIDKIFEEY